MRILFYIFETLVFAFIITAHIFMAKQPHIDVEKRDREALRDGANGLDRLNGILDADTVSMATDTIMPEPESLEK